MYNSNIMVSEISFDNLMELKAKHAIIYESGAGTQMELLNYLYDILDNINSEIIKQNKQRIKAKYGSLLPPVAIRNRNSQQQQQQQSIGNLVDDMPISLGDNDDGFQTVMPRRFIGNNKPSPVRAPYRVDGKKPCKGNTRLSMAVGGAYNQPYKAEADRISKNENDKSFSVANINNNIGNHSNYAKSRVETNSGTGLNTGGGILSRLMGTDRVKMAINREMNKLSSINMEAIANSITDVFASWLLDELNKDTNIAELKENFAKYLYELWNNLIGKSLAQENMSEVYFKFLRRIMSPLNNNTVIQCLRAKSPIMAGRLGIWQPGFHELEEYKSELLDEITEFLNQATYFEGDITLSGLANKVGGAANLTNIQQAFSIIGLFSKYFMEPPSRNSKAPSAWDIMLLAIYANFKLLNELLYWEPVNLEEVERRVFFMVGFLEDNRSFIQALDTDFYRDIECQLDSIKRCSSIPISVKYKLFDCIDNFILMRKSGASGRK